MTNGEAPAEPPDGGGAAGPPPPCGATSEAEGDGAPAGAEKVPVTLYDRWRTAFQVDGMAFGKRVRELREARGWTQKDLQVRSGVPIATISELENGQSAHPRVPLTMTLAQAFGFEHPGAMLGVPQPPRPPGAHPSGPRDHPDAAAASGLGQEAGRLLAGLLDGLWTAQERRGERRGRVTRLIALTVGAADLAEAGQPGGADGAVPPPAPVAPVGAPEAD